MLKRIAISDLEVGMYVHKFEGRWLDHPFWKARFLIEDAEKLSAIKGSRVQGIIIDTDKSRTPAPAKVAMTGPGSATASMTPPARPRPARLRAGPQLVSTQPLSLAQEVETASAIAEKGREQLEKTFIDARLGRALDLRKVEPVVSDILASVRRNSQAFSGLMRCKLKNEQIFRHALSVSALMVALADRMKLSGPEIHNCGLAGMLLDLGVNYLPPSFDPWAGGRRSSDEAIWQSHVLLGYRALQNYDSLPQSVLDACLCHHERMDGSGYPQERTGEDIPQVARMAAICDAFEFLIAGTAGCPALDPAQAVASLQEQAGAFDEAILRLFIETVGLYPVGSFVALASGKLAMVIDTDRRDPHRPIVQAFYSFESRARILPHRVRLADKLEGEHIVGIADLADLDLPEDALLRELVFLSACRNEDRG